MKKSKYRHLSQHQPPNIEHLTLLKGQKALVTGANSGIGMAIALSLAQAGADVCINYLSGDAQAAKVVQKIKSLGRKSFAYRANVTEEQEVVSMIEQIVKQFGTIDILVNNAGIQRDAPIDEMTLEQWNQVISTNLTGQFLCSREAIKEFKKRGINPTVSASAGKIIFISSVHQVIPKAHHANYAASKGGIHLLMMTLAQELAALKIRVNSIAPGAIKTKFNEGAWKTPEAYEDLLRLIPYKRIGMPLDVGRCAAWLASDHADYISGATIFIDGGMSLFPGFATGG